MSPHVERMITEQAELEEKLEKLSEFTNGDFFKTIPDIEQSLLLSQATAMATYSNILNLRIKLATKQ